MITGTHPGRPDSAKSPPAVLVLKRQLAVGLAFGLILATVVAAIYYLDRRAEWAVRSEQARHRVNTAAELIRTELQRVRTDALYLADQLAAREFLRGAVGRRAELELDYQNFVSHQQRYDQIRLLNLQGREVLRVNYSGGQARVISVDELQDKRDRYYFRSARDLTRGEVFVSDFDLNQEHGVIERPVKPVIRVVTPVIGTDNRRLGLLVLNFLGARLLHELSAAPQPGRTLLVRPDGHFVQGLQSTDAWGWLLGHNDTFSARFPAQWQRLVSTSGDEASSCWLAPPGAFSACRLWLGRREEAGSRRTVTGEDRNTMWVVAFVPRRQVFSDSAKLLQRLIIMAACMMIPLMILAWYWAQASVSRQRQMRWIAASEVRLRELSGRLLRIQEDERRAISREIHDELGQQATAISLDMKLALRQIASGEGKQHLERAIAANHQLLTTLHAFATRVRPAVLDDLGLFDAMESHLSDFEIRTGIQVNASLDFRSDDIPHEVADHAYRLLQEALNNVAKHAHASVVDVDVYVQADKASSNGARLSLRISDNGCGYQEGINDGSRLGLVGMRERVDLLGGDLRIESQADEGTLIEIELPIPAVPATAKP